MHNARPLAPGTSSAPAETAGAARPLQAEHSGMEYWRIERVARYLDISTKRVYQLVRERKLFAVHLGPRTTRILRHSIEHYLRVLTSQRSE